MTRQMIHVMIRLLIALPLISLPTITLAQLKHVQVTEVIHALVGPHGNRSPGNLGNNATFGVVVTPKGVVLVDPGGTYKGAAKIEQAIASFTDQPVKIVINTGGQDHRWLGNSYWAEHGARIITSQAALLDQQERASLQQSILAELVGANGLKGTEPVFATETFDQTMRLTLGGLTLELHHTNPAHTPGDAFVYVPSQDAIFAGDIIYTERLLAVIPVSDSGEWLKAFDAIATIDPEHLIPGHGSPTNMLQAAADTYDYLTNLRAEIGKHLEAGGDIITSVDIDQSAFAHLHNFETLAKRNAQSVFEAMEWD